MYLQISDQINVPSARVVEGAERMNDCYRFARDHFHGGGSTGVAESQILHNGGYSFRFRMFHCRFSEFNNRQLTRQSAQLQVPQTSEIRSD